MGIQDFSINSNSLIKLFLFIHLTMQRILGKRGATQQDDHQFSNKRCKTSKQQVSILDLNAHCILRVARCLNDDDLDRLSLTSKDLRKMLDQPAVWHARFLKNLSYYQCPSKAKLTTADEWKTLAKWQRSEMIFSDNSLFGSSHNRFKLHPNIVGIRKTVVTENCLFILDYAGRVHRWDEDDDWTLSVLERVVDLVTDATDLARHRTSLFVLSQSENLMQQRPALRDFYRYRRSENRNREMERALRNWHPNGAPKSGDKVDVFRIDESSLRRVFKMTFQQAHRFVSLQVSNRDYQKSDIRPYEGRNKHINELQLLTTKGRVWSLTVNEPELIANGGGAQVALKNISSRFDLKHDDEEQLLVEKIFNGKFISALLCRNGNLHLFSDLDEKMKIMFPGRQLTYTTMGTDQQTKRISTTLTTGTKIVHVSISTTHCLLLDIYGQLWGVGQNRSGQLGLGHVIDQNYPKRILLPETVVQTLSMSASQHSSVIICKHQDGSIRAHFAGKLIGGTLVGYNFVDMTNLDDDPVLLSGQNFYKFREVDVRLPAKTDEVMMTTNSLVFAVKPQTKRKFAKKPLGESTENFCRTCRDWKSSEEELRNAASDMHLHWLREKIGACECLRGQNVFRGILMERILIARHYEKAADDLDAWIANDRNFNFGDQDDLDELIEALAYSQTHVSQLPQFSMQ